jgi:hypothetical protein
VWLIPYGRTDMQTYLYTSSSNYSHTLIYASILIYMKTANLSPVFNYRTSNAMKAYGESGGINSPFLTSASDGCERSTSRFGRFTSGKSVQYPLNRKLFGHQSQNKLL